MNDTTTTRILRPLYQELATLVQARINCIASGNRDCQTNHTDRIRHLVKEYMPSGSGINNGTELDLDATTPEKLVFVFAYHHMDEYGYYDGWTPHTCVVRPSLQFGLHINITGKDKNCIKDYLYDTFQSALTALVPIR